ncbi:hypothetical protein, partial [Tatumella sp. JGM130]|uniref:hypothetical protein n=1 Tax=Tatumella sp. JGM130 TaxID=2799797 RepID=UPI002012B70F
TMNIETAMVMLKERISSLEIYEDIESDTLKFARAAFSLNENPKSIVLSMGMIKKIIENNNIILSHIELITLLTHPDIEFLQLEYLLIIDDHDEPIEISNDDMADAYTTGYLQNPKNPDQLIYDYNDFIFPTFVINDAYTDNINWRDQ